MFAGWSVRDGLDLLIKLAPAITIVFGLFAAQVQWKRQQRLNAEPVVEAGGGIMIDNAACTADWVSAQLIPLLLDSARLAAMGKAAADFGIRDGDERLADLVEKAAAEGRRS